MPVELEGPRFCSAKRFFFASMSSSSTWPTMRPMNMIFEPMAIAVRSASACALSSESVSESLLGVPNRSDTYWYFESTHTSRGICQRVAHGHVELEPQLAANVHRLGVVALEGPQTRRAASRVVQAYHERRAVHLVDGAEAVQEAAPRHVLVGPRAEKRLDLLYRAVIVRFELGTGVREGVDAGAHQLLLVERAVESRVCGRILGERREPALGALRREPALYRVDEAQIAPV